MDIILELRFIMLQALLYAFPSILVILALYIFYFRHSLQKLLKLQDLRIFNLIALTFFLLAILGFVLIYLQLKVWSLIWLVVVLILITMVSVLIYFTLKSH
ncbi:hypothetical protein [Facklamia sp. 7083-14-GEN3]|uniref:hypothetical protein n=1 Tax=Facklamia sp. 7083-14-GEN3 TaxID=2973478 RepID=UPI00215C3DF9|nr:hypothetical protein [Facklamia sp. 7083-14-GEN3]MCR8969106.1 hypothetical protein [Facklamia sp. 7083-14-GEN3]